MYKEVNCCFTKSCSNCVKIINLLLMISFLSLSVYLYITYQKYSTNCLCDGESLSVINKTCNIMMLNVLDQSIIHTENTVSDIIWYILLGGISFGTIINLISVIIGLCHTDNTGRIEIDELYRDEIYRDDFINTISYISS
jgi:hypothetical protein